jgi:hypothetical protein
MLPPIKTDTHDAGILVDRHLISEIEESDQCEKLGA